MGGSVGFEWAVYFYGLTGEVVMVGWVFWVEVLM